MAIHSSEYKGDDTTHDTRDTGLSAGGMLLALCSATVWLMLQFQFHMPVNHTSLTPGLHARYMYIIKYLGIGHAKLGLASAPCDSASGVP